MRTLLVVFFVMCIPLIEGCIPGLLCNCGYVDPYYDFKEVAVDGSVETGSKSIILEVELEEISFYADASPHYFGGSSLMACSCEEPGNLGLENGVGNVTILSDVDFGNEYPAGSSLNDLISNFSESGTESMADYIFNINNAAWWSYETITLSLSSDQVPDGQFRLRMVYLRADATEIIGETEMLSF